MPSGFLNVRFTDSELKERIEVFIAEKRKNRNAGLGKQNDNDGKMDVE